MRVDFEGRYWGFSSKNYKIVGAKHAKTKYSRVCPNCEKRVTAVLCPFCETGFDVESFLSSQKGVLVFDDICEDMGPMFQKAEKGMKHCTILAPEGETVYFLPLNSAQVKKLLGF